MNKDFKVVQGKLSCLRTELSITQFPPWDFEEEAA